MNKIYVGEDRKMALDIPDGGGGLRVELLDENGAPFKTPRIAKVIHWVDSEKAIIIVDQVKELPIMTWP
ncbi:MAG: hypothetical protein PHQ40_19390, partial [Anaerolineaceae bacterium]|nr:hypothetical protein [Anaerolineaceae bacterium]